MKVHAAAVIASTLVSATALAASVIDQNSVSVTQPKSGSLVISYELSTSGEPAFVTVNIETNAGNGVWASIGDENYTNLAGDVNRVVMPSSTPKTIHWNSYKSWPDHIVAAGNLRVNVEAWALNEPPLFMVADLVDGDEPIRFYRSKAAVPGGIEDRTYKTTKVLLRKIPAADVRWRMGLKADEVDDCEGANNAHYVTLTEDYYMAVYPMTECQYSNAYVNAECQSDQGWMSGGATPAGSYSNYCGEQGLCPVINVSWIDCRRADATAGTWSSANKTRAVHYGCFMGRFRTFTKGVVQFDLPTEAQWEYACRAGKFTSKFNDGGNDVTTVGWASENSKVDNVAVRHPVGGKAPNAWDLYDMHGNAFELCLDFWASSLDSTEMTDPAGAA